MNKWINKTAQGIEVGSGSGLSKLFIKSDNYLLTDVERNNQIDLQVDAMKLPFPNESLDFIISSNMIHHLSKPSLFFKECERVLKPEGVILIQEVYGSFFFRLILRMFRHEGYNFDIDPFDENSVCTGSSDKKSGNNVIPNILFKDMQNFERHFNFKCRYKKYREFTIFMLSGGVIKKILTVNLPRFILNLFSQVDKVLIKISKDLFAVQIQIVLQVNNPGSETENFKRAVSD